MLLPATLETAKATLCASEVERASHFLSEELRNRFIAGRGCLRAVLGHYLGVPAANIRFTYGPNGKPSLVAKQGLNFNLAHSQKCLAA